MAISDILVDCVPQEVVILASRVCLVKKMITAMQGLKIEGCAGSGQEIRQDTVVCTLNRA